MPEDALTKFTGLYELDRAANMIISKSDRKLVAQLSNDPPREMLAESETQFFDRAIDQQIKFERNAEGAVTGALLFLNGEENHAKRLPDRTGIDLSPDVLNRYVGLYELLPGPRRGHHHRKPPSLGSRGNPSKHFMPKPRIASF